MACLFCRIAAGELPSATLWEDDRTFAFLDINPLRPGHALVVPKTHAAKLEDASPADAAALMLTAQRIAPALCQLTSCPDATVAIHDGPAAGQEVPHLHVHVVPRAPGDGGGPIHALFATRPRPSPDDLNDLAMEVQVRLGAPGLKAPPKAKPAKPASAPASAGKPAKGGR